MRDQPGSSPGVEIACPACRKSSLVSDAAQAACARCGCDLGTLARIAAAADSSCRRAAAALRQGEAATALSHATRAWELRRSPAAAALAALASAVSGDLTAIQEWRLRWTKSRG